MGNKFSRWLGRALLSVAGWKVKGDLPNEPKLIVAAAPHTSNWDFLLAMCAILALGVRVSYLMKKEAFVWPFGKVFRWLGGIPLDRRSTQDIVQQIINWYQQHEKIWVAITPEGTRSKVGKWKTGFLRVAHEVHAPVFIVAWDYPSKTIYLDGCWHLTGDHHADAENIRRYISGKYCGKYSQKQ